MEPVEQGYGTRHYSTYTAYDDHGLLQKNYDAEQLSQGCAGRRKRGATEARGLAAGSAHPAHRVEQEKQGRLILYDMSLYT